MPKIKNVLAREILDSRGNPTIECDIILEDNSLGRYSVPSGASKGKYEAHELRDNDKNRYHSKGVLNAISNINKILKDNIINIEVLDQELIDNKLISLDESDNKSILGANSILAVSMACVKAAANYEKKYLFEYLSDESSHILPVPMINIINGGMHADNNVSIQEFMIAPIGFNKFKEALRAGSEIFHNLKNILKNKGLNTSVGDEGGFAPHLKSSNEAIELILEAISKTGYKPGKEIYISLDVASSSFFENNLYKIYNEEKAINSENMCEYLIKLTNDYPIYSIEDGLAENDFEGWKILSSRLNHKIQLVGDDLFATNLKLLKDGINNNIANSILIKPNQIGTLTETKNVIKHAKLNNYSCVISHRSGETEDTSIADLAVAFKTGQIKTGSISRSDRLAKYNQLLRIEEILGNNALYAGNNILKFEK
ncbi:MAG: Enolase [Alphaproteobacteria bacterium MarineAlpha5_Bin12]|nr:MAG: Enolase [Alphaproteobacteria bacterium MarineAlpha5_Bin12]|tara:strand:- start:41328 stop:42611 length:1284 start_codon:yes stop_codon:yes gene_type:complete